MAEVRQMIDKEKNLPADVPRSSGRNNNLGLANTTFNRACRMAGFHPYKLSITPRGRVEGKEREARLKFSQFVADKDDDFFRRLIVTDEKIFK